MQKLKTLWGIILIVLLCNACKDTQLKYQEKENISVNVQKDRKEQQKSDAEFSKSSDSLGSPLLTKDSIRLQLVGKSLLH